MRICCAEGRLRRFGQLSRIASARNDVPIFENVSMAKSKIKGVLRHQPELPIVIGEFLSNLSHKADILEVAMSFYPRPSRPGFRIVQSVEEQVSPGLPWYGWCLLSRCDTPIIEKIFTNTN
jgi:hypothetical protein